MTGVPESVAESLVPYNVTLDPVTDKVGYLDVRTGSFLQLSPAQLEEVAVVYNAWRVGNLQDCAIRNESQLLRVRP